MTYKEITGTAIVKLGEQNKVLEGTLLGIEDGQFGPQFRFMKSDGTEVVLGNQTVLATKIHKKLVGKKLKVEFVGNVKSKATKNTYADYKVFVDE